MIYRAGGPANTSLAALTEPAPTTLSTALPSRSMPDWAKNYFDKDEDFYGAESDARRSAWLKYRTDVREGNVEDVGASWYKELDEEQYKDWQNINSLYLKAMETVSNKAAEESDDGTARKHKYLAQQYLGPWKRYHEGKGDDDQYEDNPQLFSNVRFVQNIADLSEEDQEGLAAVGTDIASQFTDVDNYWQALKKIPKVDLSGLKQYREKMGYSKEELLKEIFNIGGESLSAYNNAAVRKILALKDFRKGGFRGPKQYAAGGAQQGIPTSMYSNVIPGSMGATSSIVFQEQDPDKLEKEEEELRRLETDETWKNEAILREQRQAAVDAGLGALTKTTEMGFNQWAKQKGFENWSGYLADKAAKKAAAEAAKSATTEVVKTAGTEAIKTTGTEAVKGVGTEVAKEVGKEVVEGAGTELAKTAGTEVLKTTGKEVTKEVGKEVLKETGKEVGKTATTAAAASSFNPSPYAAAANIVGKGISMASDDQDATTWNVGEATGDIIGGAGEYAGYGAMIGSVVPGVGTAIGAGVGAVIGAGKAVWQGLANRAKAKKEKKEHDIKVSDQRQARDAVKFARRKYSGYDFGQNLAQSKYGGYRLQDGGFNPLPLAHTSIPQQQPRSLAISRY